MLVATRVCKRDVAQRLFGSMHVDTEKIDAFWAGRR